AEDVDLAMTKGVNYPKGLLRWGEEIGLSSILGVLDDLQDLYGEDRYHPNPLLKQLVDSNGSFFSTSDQRGI
ncbi:MAG TPA: 3-hydroxyacyl-CoA dehydrogenase family protein, partial [Balneolales bacterium]|nr:3-hydroxyacyl-CoA dehydrogenase family protein [Balneolales bacterium]